MYRKHLKDIEAINDEVKNKGYLMTDYEKATMSQKKRDMVASYGQYIEKNILAELEKAYGDFKDEERWLNQKKAREINSWDAEKLGASFGVMRVLMDMAVVSDNPASKERTKEKLERLWQEASDSGDKYKMRAFHELIDGVIAKHPDRDEAMRLNHLKTESAKKIEEVRSTPEIIEQEKELYRSYQAFIQKELEAKIARDNLGDASTLDDYLRRVDKYMDGGLPRVEVVEEEGQLRKPLRL